MNQELLECRCSIQGHDIEAPWVYFRASCLLQAKRKATQEWGAGYLHHHIILEVISKKKGRFGVPGESITYIRPIRRRGWQEQ